MKILHVEDEPFCFAIVRHACRESEIVHAESLTEARAILAVSSFDLLLVDLNLSDSRGSDTVEALKPYCLPMVVLTGDRSAQHAADCRVLGVDDFLLKDLIVKPGFEARLKAVHCKHLKKWGAKCNLAFPDIEALKPYLSTATAFASLALAAHG